MNKLDEWRLERLEARYKSRHSFTRYYGLLFSAVVLFSILSCVLVLALAHYGNLKVGRYDLLYALAIIPLANAFFGAATRWAGKVWYQRERVLIDGIERVSQGDFFVRLETTKVGSWENIYRNFNKMMDELQNYRIMNENFIKDLSHELKTPIASIHGFAEILLSDEITKEERRQYLQIIADQSARLASLAQNTLMLSKIDSQQFIMAKNTFALDEQIKQCLILFSGQWKEKGLSFSADLEEVAYWGNEELLEQVWINLLNNAGKFTPAGGEICVSMQKHDEEIILACTDSGIGMSKEVQEHIFDRYYQGDRSRATAGHGLGLAIVWRIIQLHGGRITVESAPNAGSTFWIHLPIGDALAEADKETMDKPAPILEGCEQMKRVVSVQMINFYLAGYQDFGWQVVAEEAAKQKNQVCKKIIWQRPRFWSESPQLNQWQTQLEKALHDIAVCHQRANYWAMVVSIGVGLISSTLLAAVMWCLAHQQYFWGTALFILSICGCALAYFLHEWLEEWYLRYHAPFLRQTQQRAEDYRKQAQRFIKENDWLTQEET